MKKIALISFVMLVILTLTAVSAADNMTIENASTDENYIAEENVHSFLEIQDDIDDADENSTVTLNGTYTGSGKEISISKSITLEGTGSNTVLDANSSSRILNISSGKVTLKNLNFINGKTNSIGGAIHAAGELTIINCTFKNNTADANEDNGLSLSELYWNQVMNEGIDTVACGGAIYSESDLTAINSSFIENSAFTEEYSREMDYYWVEDCSEGGAIYSKGNIILNNSSVSKNHSGTYDIISLKNLTINDCEFRSGSASSGQSLLINNTEFRYDSKLYLYNQNKLNTSCTILNSNFKEVENTLLSGEANSFLIENNSFTDSYIYYGSLISISGKTVEISKNTFLNNTVGHRDMISISARNCKILNTDFIANHINGNHIFDSDYGIVSLESGKSNFTQCRFINNSAPTAGAIHCSNSDISIENSTFENNGNATLDISNANLTVDGIEYEYYSRVLLDDSFDEIPNYISINLAKTYTVTYPTKNIKIKVPATLSYNKDMEIHYFFHAATKESEENYMIQGYYDNIGDLYSDQSRDSKNGIVTFYLDNMPAGTYVITISQLDYDLEITSILKIKKAKTTVKAPKVTAKYKKSKYFKITVKSNKKAIKNLKIKVKVYTGKKYKTYKLKTNKKGVAQINTKKLKKGNHKVIISSLNKNYSVSAKSKIKIK